MNSIGLDEGKSKILTEKLNLLLASYHVFYMNARGFHWNIRGDKFFELHLKFEELYTDLQVKIDEIAERVLTLGEIPLHSFEDYSKNSSIKAIKNVSDGKNAVQEIISSFKTVLLQQRELLQLSAEAVDEGTNALMSDYIRAQEKLVWMYSSFLGK